MRCCIPWSAMFVKSGEILPPCGTPSCVSWNPFLSAHLLKSITPALSHALIWRSKMGKVLSFSNSLVWFILSKHRQMSASKTYFGFWAMYVRIASTASWQDLPGLKPYDSDSKRAFHSGSNASLISVCFALSSIVGIPSPRFSGFPGLGIQTLRVGVDFPFTFRFFASSNRAGGFKDFIPSTPAVTRPLLSCVTRRTAISFADQDWARLFWIRLTVWTSPRYEAR